MKPDRTANDKLLERLSMASGCGCDVGVNEMVLKAHAALASAPSLLITATLDDALAVEERPNMPGTTDSWPNWSIALPATLEEICEAPAPRAIAHAMSQRRRE